MFENIILFLMFFVLIYLMYYFLFVRKQLRYNKKKLPSDVKIFEFYYKIDVKKIGYQKVLRTLNFTNALMLSIMLMIVYKLDSIILKILVLTILIVPFIWVTYYFLAKYFKYLEGNDKK
jgi:hypothetical protein